MLLIEGEIPNPRCLEHLGWFQMLLNQSLIPRLLRYDYCDWNSSDSNVNQAILENCILFLLSWIRMNKCVELIGKSELQYPYTPSVILGNLHARMRDSYKRRRE